MRLQFNPQPLPHRLPFLYLGRFQVRIGGDEKIRQRHDAQGDDDANRENKKVFLIYGRGSFFCNLALGAIETSVRDTGWKKAPLTANNSATGVTVSIQDP